MLFDRILREGRCGSRSFQRRFHLEGWDDFLIETFGPGREFININLLAERLRDCLEIESCRSGDPLDRLVLYRIDRISRLARMVEFPDIPFSWWQIIVVVFVIAGLFATGGRGRGFGVTGRGSAGARFAGLVRTRKDAQNLFTILFRLFICLIDDCAFLYSRICLGILPSQWHAQKPLSNSHLVHRNDLQILETQLLQVIAASSIDSSYDR